jgi:heme exporter protein C
MPKFFAPLAVVAALMFAYAPVAIAGAPYESTMLLVQKIFYFHISTWIAMSAAITVCAVGSLLYLFRGSAAADRYAFASAELTLVFCTFGLVSGSLWARKAWGQWWQWDAKLTMALMLELVFVGYLLVRKYAGPGSEKLAAAMGIFGAATAPFIYKAADWWRTIHPKTSVVPTLIPAMRSVMGFCAVSFLLLFVLLLMMRVHLEERRAELDRLYLEADA